MAMPDQARAAVPLRWRSAALTDRGRVRVRNEDAFLASADSALYAVADGMGGHAAGDVASRLAVRALGAAFDGEHPPAADAESLAARLRAAFVQANETILEHARVNSACAGMGTTLTCLAPLSTTSDCVLVHIGDSRAYCLRGGDLVQLTRDHTWVQEQVDAGMLTPRQARHHPNSSVLTRVLGMPDPGPADAAVVEVEPGDRYLLCSDGLTNMIEHPDLREMLLRDVPLEQHARDLIDAANLRGGIDNATVVLLAADRV